MFEDKCHRYVRRIQSKTKDLCASASLCLSLSFIQTANQGLQTVWIQKTVRRFARPDQGPNYLTDDKQAYQSACPTLRPMRTVCWVYSFKKKKKSWDQTM